MHDCRRFGGVSTVTIVIGADKIAFIIHQDILYEASPFFKAGFESKFREGTARSMDLPEEDRDIFEYFTHWLYYQHSDPLTLAGYADNKDAYIINTVHLYTLADRYGVVKLKNNLCKNLCKISTSNSDRPLPQAALDHIYNNTTSNAMIRRLFADWYAWHVDPKYFAQPELDSWLLDSAEMSVDVLRAFARKQVAYEVQNTSRSSYGTYQVATSPFSALNGADVYMEKESSTNKAP